MMRVDPADREYATLDVTLDTDPTGSIEMLIDDTWTTMTWVAASVTNTDGTFSRSARLLVAGPDVDPASNPAGTVVLALGSHPTKWRLTDDPELLARPGDVITVG